MRLALEPECKAPRVLVELKVGQLHVGVVALAKQYDDDTVMNTDDGGGSARSASRSRARSAALPACSWSSKSDSCTSASLKLAKQYDDDTVMNTDDGGGSGSICVSPELGVPLPRMLVELKSDSCTSAWLMTGGSSARWWMTRSGNTDNGGGSGGDPRSLKQRRVQAVARLLVEPAVGLLHVGVALKLAKESDDDTVMNTDDGGGSGRSASRSASSECKRSPACRGAPSEDSTTSASWDRCLCVWRTRGWGPNVSGTGGRMHGPHDRRERRTELLRRSSMALTAFPADSASRPSWGYTCSTLQ